MIDLLRLKSLDRLAASRFYPMTIQAFLLLCFALVIAGGLAAPHVSARIAGTLRNTNLAALIVWSLWWPLVIITAVLFTRVWCQVCPMELINSLLSRIGLKRKVPRLLTSGWGGALFYTLILLGFIRTFRANRFPDRMALFFLVLLAAAVFMGFMYEKRAFCNYLCPVGRLLGLYGCCAALEWRAADRAVCQDCQTKECIDDALVYRLTGRSCPGNLYPPSIRDNRECQLCTQCRKVCPHGNLRLSLRRPMADFFTDLRLSSPEFLFVFFVSGLAIWEMAEEWDPAEAVLEFLPDRLSTWLGFSGDAASFLHTLVIFVLMPTLLFLLPGWIGARLNRVSLLESVKIFSLVFLPVVALIHLLKALFRITSRLPYYALAFKDPVGYETANRIVAGDLQPDMQIATALFPIVSWIAVPVLVGIVVYPWIIGLRSPACGNLERGGRVPYLAFVTLYSVVLALITVMARF